MTQISIDLKKQLYQILKEQINQRVDTAQQAMQAAESSKSSQTKSSAGDKFETSRAMMQAEEDRSKVQLIRAIALKNELTSIPIHQEVSTVGLGSLVFTNQGNYFISIGIGKIIIESTPFYAISVASPIGQLLDGKKEGDKVTFREKTIVIKQII